MSDTLEAISPAPTRYVEERPNTSPSRLWQRLGLGGVMIVSIFMNFFQLGQNGFANTYYAAAIRRLPNEVSDVHRKNVSAIFRETR